MSSELSRTELSCLITHKKGFAFKSKDYIPSGVPVVRVSNFTWDSISTDDLRYVSHEVASSTKVVQLNEYDVIVATVGSWPQNPDSIVGKVVRVPCPLSGALLNQNTVRLRVNDDNLVNQKYLYIALKTKEFSDHLISKAQGSANQASITLSDIFSYAIPWGTYTQRKYIVNVIDSINDKIIIANQINQTLEQMAQALFKSWFVDFEPVKAKIAVLEAGGSQEAATLAAMAAISGKDTDALAVFEREHPEHYAELKATAELFPSAMQESELGAIPIDWDIKNIKSMSIALSKGTTPAKKDLSSEENQNINFLKVKDIGDDGRINYSNLDKISKRVHEMVLKRSVLQCNDILFSIAGTIGRVAVVASDMLACNCNQAIAFIRLKNCASHLNLVRLNLQSPRIQQEVESKVVQGVQANLSLTALGELEVVLPTDYLLIAFNNVITPIWEQKLSITKSIMLLTLLRDTLLPKLLSGEITLPEAEQAVCEAENV